MKKTLLSLVFAVGASVSLLAQLVNQGASIIIEDGATLIVETDVDNMTGSTLDNQGTLIVKGDMTNAGTWTNSSTSTVRFEGTGDSELTSGGATIYKVEVDKTSGNVTLQDDAVVSSSLEWIGDGKVVLGDHDMTLAAAATTTGQAANRYVDASGTGSMRKIYDSNSSFLFPVGDDDDYSPVTIASNGGSYAGTPNVGVNVTDAVLTAAQPADATDYISRYWSIDASSFATAPNFTLTGTYASTGDVVGDAADINGVTYDAVNGLDVGGQAGGGGTVQAVKSAGAFDFTGTNRYGMIALNAYLQGPLNAAGTSMSTAINGILPLTSPYTAGETVAAIPATDIVDWVEIEVYDAAASGANMVASASAFLKDDGSVVALSGEGDPIIKNAPASGFVAVRHRNHLGVMHDASTALNGTQTVDFTSTGTSTFGTDAQASVGSSNAMWAGDADGNNEIVYSGGQTDIIPIAAAVFTDPLNSSFDPTFVSVGYSDADTDLNGEIVYSGGTTDIIKIAFSVFTNPSNISFDPTTPLTGTIGN